MIVRQIGLVLLVLGLFTGSGAGAEEAIYKISILGNVKVEEGVIRGAIKSREGGPFAVEKIREDLRSMFDLGSFTDVQVDIKQTARGKEVIFIVVEIPSIKDILIKGQNKVKLDDIKEKVTLTSRSILNLEKVKENSEQIRKVYFSKGYYGVKVEYKVDYLETNEAVVRRFNVPALVLKWRTHDLQLSGRSSAASVSKALILNSLQCPQGQRGLLCSS